MPVSGLLQLCALAVRLEWRTAAGTFCRPPPSGAVCCAFRGWAEVVWLAVGAWRGGFLSVRPSAFPVPLSQFRFQFPDPGLGSGAGFPLGVGAGPLIVEADDVLLGLRVVPPQFPVFPPDVEVQRGAVALQDAVFDSSMGTGSYRPSTSRSPARRVPWNSPVWPNRQYSGMPRAA